MRIDAGGFLLPENRPLDVRQNENGFFTFPIHGTEYQFFPGRPIRLEGSGEAAEGAASTSGADTTPRR